MESDPNQSEPAPTSPELQTPTIEDLEYFFSSRKQKERPETPELDSITKETIEKLKRDGAAIVTINDDHTGAETSALQRKYLAVCRRDPDTYTVLTSRRETKENGKRNYRLLLILPERKDEVIKRAQISEVIPDQEKELGSQ